MVNDLSSCIKNCEMSQFADDGAIWKSGPNLKHLQNKIQPQFLIVDDRSLTIILKSVGLIQLPWGVTF
jgi:hypothetical protein